MKVRIKFQKFGAMKFIGHLDVMRYFQKVFRRAGIDIRYTGGYSPHQIMSFAAPLGVGLTSDGEYVDIELLSSDSADAMIDRINSALTDGFRVTGFHFLKEREADHKKVTAMALVSSADYLVSLKDGYTVSGIIDTQEKFKKAFEEFLSRQEIVIDKKTKTNEKSVDIRPMITMAAFDRSEYEEKLNSIIKETDKIKMEDTSEEISNGVKDGIKPSEGISDEEKDSIKPMKEISDSQRKTDSAADIYQNGIKVYLQLDTGSSVNLKPELVIEAFCNDLGIEFQSFAWQMHRLEVYTREDETKKLIPLDRLER